MTDQVNLLPTLTPPIRQLGFPGAPCGGRSCCTDSVGVEIVRRDRGRTITPAAFRRAARPIDPNPCGGLTPGQFLNGLRAFGVKGYEYADHVTASTVLEATDRGIVLVGVGYAGYPTVKECQAGGKVDMGFVGSHAISLWGRRKVAGRWVCWTRDPDHHWNGMDGARPAPAYDRFDTTFLSRAINALPGTSGWSVTFAIWRRRP
jgi:hypothetical protein